MEEKPIFVRYVNAISDVILESHLNDASQKLTELIHSENDGVSLKAIELIFKTYGKVGSKAGQEDNKPRQSRELSEDIEALESRLEQLKKSKPIEVDFKELN